MGYRTNLEGLRRAHLYRGSGFISNAALANNLFLAAPPFSVCCPWMIASAPGPGRFQAHYCFGITIGVSSSTGSSPSSIKFLFGGEGRTCTLSSL